MISVSNKMYNFQLISNLNLFIIDTFNTVKGYVFGQYNEKTGRLVLYPWNIGQRRLQ